MEQAKIKNQVAWEFVEQLGIPNPTNYQLELVENLISSISSLQIKKIAFHQKLSQKESLCLYWTALGKTAEQTAELLRVKKQTILTHRKEIKRKLKCDSMAQAVFVGVTLKKVYKPNKVFA